MEFAARPPRPTATSWAADPKARSNAWAKPRTEPEEPQTAHPPGR